jgi:XTP/dITP diphosphohydrolase/tetrapyrrole methylase family protein/MazG family protein/ATP diphosphatase
MDESAGRAFSELLSVMRRLRGEGGCPWDREQTMESIRAYVIEEAYELVDAITGGGPEEIREECGDLLLQVVFIAQMASEAGVFNASDVVRGLTDKMIRRHPHVFAGSRAESSEEVLENWEQIKAGEKERKKKKDTSLLSGLPAAMPPLAKAFRIQGKAAHVGFDWPAGDLAPLYDKVEEELLELKEAIGEGDPARVEEEFGDLLFAAVNMARHLSVNPDAALGRANSKFAGRFREVERLVAESSRPWSSFTTEELDRLWEEAKAAPLTSDRE